MKLDAHPLNPVNIPGASRRDRERWKFYLRNVEKHIAAERAWSDWMAEFRKSLALKRRDWVARHRPR